MSISEWHYVRGGVSVGPVSTPKIETLIASGDITPDTFVWNDTLPEWEPARLHFDIGQGDKACRETGPDGLYVGAPARGFGDAIKTCLAKYATFRGRASRSEYWYFVLFSSLVQNVAVAVGTVGGPGFLNGVLSVALVLPSLAVSVRRLHDTNKSGWWLIAPYALILVAMISGALPQVSDDAAVSVTALVFFGGLFAYVVTLLVFLCQRGQPGPNRFG